MNNADAKGYLPLVQAMADGKTIQFNPTSGTGWRDILDMSLNYPVEQYRIKPEPMALYVNVYSDGSGTRLAYESLETAERAGKHAPNIVRRAVKFIEAKDQS